MTEPVERRLVFGSVAQSYDRHRPSYPAALVDDVLAYAGIADGSGPLATPALEVGAGTGIATRLFAARGLSITAVEPDAAMAAVASQRAATARTIVAVRITDFEQLELEPGSFRLLYSGTAWHWIDPERRLVLAARALASGGALAAFWNRPVWEGNPVRAGFDAAYESVGEAFDAIVPGPMNPTAELTVIQPEDWRAELEGVADFAQPQTRSYRWAQPYTREQYLGLLGTHSDHILLPAPSRARLFAGIGAAIDALGGSFELTYETLLCLARRR